VAVCPKWKVALWLALYVQAPPHCVATERYVFDVFDLDRGLGNSTVTRLARDHQGALWVGTENGLYRYDGHRFLAFTTNQGLPSNKITAIHESPDGTLWVGTLEGLAWREGAGFRQTANEALKGYITPQGIASDRTGRIFIATRKGVAMTLRPAPGRDLQLTFLPWPSTIPQQRSSSVYVSSPDEVWFDCDVAICRWNGREIQVWNNSSGVPPHKWDFLLKDRSGNLWARNRDSFIELPSGANRFQPVGPDLPGRISIPPELAMDDKGRILLTDNRGLAIGGPDGWRRVTEKQGLPASLVTAVLQDTEGSLWLGTYGAGLARWAGYGEWCSFSIMEGLAGSSILSLVEDPPSGMWAGTAGGLSHGVFSKGTWKWSEVSIPGVNLVGSLVRAKDGALWMVTDSHYVVRYDPVSRTSRRLGPFASGPFDLRIDTSGRLWIAEAGSVAVGGAPSRIQDLERIRPPGAPEGTLFTATVEDARGNLWIASMSGLFRRSQGKWLQYGASSGLRASRIIDLALSPEGDLWVTYSEPLGADRLRITGDTVQVENFDRSKGLTSDRVNSVSFDRQGQLWILNDRGAEVRHGTNWVQFSRVDGLISSGSAGRAFCAATDGAIWIGSERGLSRYQPAGTAQTRPEPLSVKFSEVRIGNKTFDPASTSLIEASPQIFEARFSALLLAHSADVQYRYRFAGLDDRWQETSRPEARLDYPRPGRYRLEVQARRNAQPWSMPPATLALEVRPHWYDTGLFRGAVLALICVTVYLLEKFREKTAAAARLALKRTVERRTAQLRESEARFRNMADTAPVLIWVSGPDRLFTFFNKTWLDFTGHDKDQELGNAWSEGVHLDDVDRCVASYYSAFEGRLSFQTEFRRRRVDGEYRWVLCSGVPRFTAGGEFAGYIGSEIDITDVKRAEQEVVSRQKLESLGVLTGGIAHDFNNLLGSILADAELAHTDLAEGLPPHEELQRIKAVAIRASEIVRELMIYSGQDRAVLEPVDISQLVEEMLELLKVSVSKHAVLRTDLGVNLPVVMGNAPRIRQIVMNLMINASEAIGTKGGAIHIGTSCVTGGADLAPDDAVLLPVSEYLRLEISDTGCGMTAGEKARVFDPFFSTKFAGRGLGLAVVQGIVRAHGGAIHLVSAPGQGTTFQIFFPCGGPTAQPESRTDASKAPDRATCIAGTVLLVEDEQSLRLAVAKMLRKQGFSVIEAADGSSAIQLFRAHQEEIDVILLDMTIPGSPSREVIQETARLRPEIKVILMSAYSSETAAASLNAPQIRGFIRKPFQLGALVELLRSTWPSGARGFSAT
jgi:PAS domain S-box-containing protein